MVRRVVITGMGLISPLGNSQEALWDALSAGREDLAREALTRKSGISTQLERRTGLIRGLIHQILPAARSLHSAVAWQAKRNRE